MISQQGGTDFKSIQHHVETLKRLLKETTATMQHQEFTKKVVIELSLLAQSLELNTLPQQKDQNFSVIETLLYQIIVENDSGGGGSSGASMGQGKQSKRHIVPITVSVVRRTLCRTIGALYGKQTHLVSRFANRLFSELTTLSSQRSTSWVINATCILFCLGSLYQHAATYMPALTNNMHLFQKLWKCAEANVRIGILVLLTEYSSSANHNSLSHDWAEILRFCKLATAEAKSTMVRLQAAECLYMVAKTVSPRAASSKNFDASLALCVRGMDDSDSNVRSMFGSAAGQLMYGVTSFSPSDSIYKNSSGTSPGGSTANTEKKSGLSFGVLSRKKNKTYTFISSLIVLTTPFARMGASRSVRHSISVAVIGFLKQCTMQTLHANMDILISHLIGLLSNVKNYLTTNDLQQAMFYVGNMIRMSIGYHMDEAGRIAALKELSKIAGKFTNNEYALVCILREIAILCKLTGETVITQRDIVLDAVLLCLRHSSEYVRFIGCMVLRALAESIPSQNMSLVNAMLNMVQMDLAELAIPSPDSAVQYGNSLHGHANALAALISTSFRYKLSVSHLLCSAALDTAVLLAKKNSLNDNEYGTTDEFFLRLLSKFADKISNIERTTTTVTMRRDEACWILVSAALSLNDTWLRNSMEKILDLWDRALGAKSDMHLSSEPETLLSQLKSRSMAVFSVAIFLKRCPELLSTEQMVMLYKYLENTIELISSLPSTFKPPSTATVNAMTVLKMYLFEAFRRLPSSIIADRQHKSAVNMITKMAFAEADGTATMVETSLLSSILDSSGYGVTANGTPQDQMEELLDGEDVDSVGYFYDEELLVDSSLEADSSCVFHDSSKFFVGKPLSLSTRLVDQSIKLLGRLFVFHKPNSKKQILDHSVNQLKIVLSQSEDVRSSHVVFSNVIANVYCILKQLTQRETTAKESRSYISSIHAILNSSLGHRNGKIRRASSECMALLGMIVGKTLVDDVIKRCAVKIVGDGPLNAGYALTLGSVNHALGSLTALSYLPSTVSFLHTLARANSSKIQLSALHSLYKTIESTGAGFSSHIEATLQLITTIVFSAHRNPPSYESDRHILLGCSRVIAAMADLGPEVSGNANFASLYRFFIYDFLCSSLESVQLEATLLVERAAMLAPNLLFAMNQLLIPKLRELLVSETTRNNLRQMAAGSVKILAEREPGLVGDLMPVDLLFQMLNNVHQFDERHKKHFEEIIILLLRSKTYEPYRWIELIREIVASQPKQYSTEGATDESAGVGELMADTDTKVSHEISREPPHPICYSWQSKLFALVCLRMLMGLYREDTSARKPTRKTQESTENPLILRIGDIVDTATFAASRGTVSSIREGLLTMISLIEIFGNVPDPQVPSEAILQQYSAKFSAVIAQGFAAASSPLVMTATSDLVAAFVTSKIVKGQTNTMTRNCAHLTNRLESLKAIHFSQYGEVAASMVKVAILRALAVIFISAHSNDDKELNALLEEPIDVFLLRYWYDLLVDYAVLSLKSPGDENSLGTTALSTANQQKIASLPTHFYEAGIESDVIRFFDGAYPSVMNALLRAGVQSQSSNSTAPSPREEQYKSLREPIEPGLVVGLAVRGLFDKESWKGNAPTDAGNVPSLQFMDTLKRVIETKQFLLLPHAPDEVYGIFLLMIKMQDSRHTEYQVACLDLLTSIVRSCDSDFFSRGSHSVEVVLTTIVEVCLKPLKLHFPSMFEQDSEQEIGSYKPGKGVMDIVTRSMKCLKHILRRFAIGMHGGNITTILYTICRVLQFTQSTSTLEVAATLTILTPDSSYVPHDQTAEEDDDDQETPTVWNVAFRAAIENILVRMEKYIITTPCEVQLLFICLFGIQRNTSGEADRRSLQTVQAKVVETFNRLLQDASAFEDVSKLKVIGWILRGMQDGVLRVAKAGHVPYAVHYLGQLCPSIVTFMMDIANGKVSITSSDETEQLIMQVIPSGLNILLAAYSLLTDSDPKRSFLAVVVPLLVVLMRFTNRPSESDGSTRNMQRLHKLCVECLERLATTAVQEFRQLIQKMPAGVTMEIQNAVKRNTAQVHAHVSEIRHPDKKKAKTSMSINFNQYK